MLDYKEALSYGLSGEAIFITGSGFSIGATNELGTSLLTGGELAKKLCMGLDLDDDLPLDLVAQEYIDSIGERSLVKLLKKQFSVDGFSDYYTVFSRIPSLKVYTTNYDDLIEEVCKENGKKIQGLTLANEIDRVNKRNMVLHLNGWINDLDNELNETFKLTHLSYNDTPLYNSWWYPYLKDELRSARAIFIVGMSFKSDLDLRRIIGDSNENIVNKCFIVQPPSISGYERSFLSKYGRVISSGIEQFCNDLNNATYMPIDKTVANYKFSAFVKNDRGTTYNQPSDKDLFNLFFLGKYDNKNLFYQDADGKFTQLVNREELNRAVELISKGDSLVLHSDLGNGKDIFINQLIYLLPEIDFYTLDNLHADNFANELEILNDDLKKKIIIIKTYNNYYKEIRKLLNYEFNNLQFIFSARTAMHENSIGALYETIDLVPSINLGLPINLNKMKKNDLVDFNQILAKSGFWGDHAGLSEDSRIRILQERCKSSFQSSLLYLFEGGDIQTRFEKILETVISDSTLLDILLLSFINEILELNLNYDDFSIIFDQQNIDRAIRKRKEDLGEFVDYGRNRLSIKSSIISKALIKSKFIDRRHVMEVLLNTSNRLDLLYKGNRKYSTVLKNIATASYLSFIFDYELESQLIIEYYEKIKENKFNSKNIYFWQQYAIVCLNVKEFERAEKYFKTAYALAKRSPGFSTFQIDTQYARYLLEYQVYSMMYANAIDVFIKAHKLLISWDNKGTTINDRYYQFKVAAYYKEFYDTFYDSFDEIQKERFIDRCKEMQRKLVSYLKSNHENELKKYIGDCQRNLEYILQNYDK